MTTTSPSRFGRQAGLFIGLFGVFPWTVDAQSKADSVLHLSEAVRQAVGSHPGVRSADALVDAAAGALSEARSARWPQLSLSAGITQFQEPMIVAPLHAFDINQQPRFDRTLIGGDLSVQYTVFDGGARGARIGQVAADRTVSMLDRESVEMRLIADVTESYLRVLTARGIRDAQLLRIAALDEERSRVDLLLASGQAARVEMLRVDAALAQARAELVATETALDLSERRLARLTGIPLERTRSDRLRTLELHEPVVTIGHDDLITRAAAHNPTLASARERVAAAQMLERSVSAAWFPRIDIGAGYVGFASAGAGSTAEWQAGIRLSYAIFTGGRRTSAVRVAEARTSLAAAQRRTVELETAELVDRAATGLREWQARVTAGTTAVQHLTEVARIEQLALTEGARTQSDYLRAEAELMQARAQLVEARHGVISATIALARAVGDLSIDWLDRMLESSP